MKLNNKVKGNSTNIETVDPSNGGGGNYIIINNSGNSDKDESEANNFRWLTQYVIVPLLVASISSGAIHVIKSPPNPTANPPKIQTK